jgi:hypothetical protein
MSIRHEEPQNLEAKNDENKKQDQPEEVATISQREQHAKEYKCNKPF